MKLFKNKVKKIAAVGVLSFGLILGMFTGQALACDKCKDLRTVVKVNDNGLVYEVDVWENIKWAESMGYIKEEDVFKEFENSLRGAASEMATVYPKYELLEIDGKPWQLTSFVELLKK